MTPWLRDSHDKRQKDIERSLSFQRVTNVYKHSPAFKSITVSSVNNMETHAEVQKIKTGTTTVGLICKDGTVLAADKRATMGYMIASKDIDKIHQIDDHMALTIAGGVGDAQMLVRWMRAETRLYKLKHGKPMSLESGATLLANILGQNKYYPFFVQLLLGGFDTKPRVYSIDMLGGVTEEKFTSTGSGSPFAYGVLEEMYSEQDTTEEGCKKAAKAVSAAMKRDAASGEGVDIVVIGKSGFRRCSKEEMSHILAK